MPNKNILIVGAAALLIIGGLIYNFSGKNSPGAESPNQGVKNLTREAAAEIILAELKEKPYPAKKTFVSYSSEEKSYYFLSYLSPEMKLILQNLEKDGLLKNGRVVSSPGSSDTFYFDFTNKAQPYLKKSPDPGDSDVDIVLANPVSVEVTGLTAPNENSGQKTVKAEFTAKYELTPFSKVITGASAAQKEQVAGNLKSFANFTLYDDGWRLTW